jgi:hypothetical protein
MWVTVRALLLSFAVCAGGFTPAGVRRQTKQAKVEAIRKELERLRAENAELKGRFEGGGESSSAITTRHMGQTTTTLVPDKKQAKQAKWAKHGTGMIGGTDSSAQQWFMDDVAPKRQVRHHHKLMNSGRAAGDLKRMISMGSCHANFSLNAHGTLCSGDSVVPTFFLIGAQKCGTTSLADQVVGTFPNFELAKIKLSDMSRIQGSVLRFAQKHQAKTLLHAEDIPGDVLPVKEVHFFDLRQTVTEEATTSRYSCSYYLSEYQHAPACSGSGSLGIGIDATPAYFPTYKMAWDIKFFFGRSWAKHARFALILRPPEDRMLSFYNHFCGRKIGNITAMGRVKIAAGCKDMTFRDWALEGVALHKRGGMHCRTSHARSTSTASADAICASMYADKLAPWLEAFSPSQFLLVPFSKYTTDPRPALKAIGSQLGILTKQIEEKIDTSAGEAEHDNAARKKDKSIMSPRLKAELAAFFRPYNLDLQALVQKKQVPVAYDDGSQAHPVLF